MAETLSASDRELNFMQFGGKDSGIVSSSSNSTNELSLIGYSSEISQNSKLEFSVKLNNPNFNCGDLYITIYDISNSEKQVLTQSGFLKQCFVQNDNKLPVGENYSQLISESGNYEIHVEIWNEKYSEKITISESLSVK